MRGSRRLGLLGVLLLGLLVAVSIYDAFFVRVESRQTYLGYAIGGPAALIVLVSCLRLRLPRPLSWIVPVWVAATFAYLAVALYKFTNPPNFIGSDALALAMPLLLLLAVVARPALTGEGAVKVVLIGLGVAATVAPLVVPSGLRHDPPGAVVVAGAWIWFARRPGPIPAICLTVLLYLTFSSGYRTQVLLWGVLGIFAFGQTRKRLRGGLILGTATGALLLALGVVPLEVDASSSRILTIRDQSSIQRVSEVQDAFDAMEEWPVWQYPLGAGFGSQFPAERASGSLGVNKTTGLLHHIHHGPMTMLFRGGLLGLSALAGLALAMIRAVRRGYASTFTHDFFPLAMAGLLVEFLTANVTLYPVFGYVVAGFLADRYSRQQRLPSSAKRMEEAATVSPERIFQKRPWVLSQ